LAGQKGRESVHTEKRVKEEEKAGGRVWDRIGLRGTSRLSGTLTAYRQENKACSSVLMTLRYILKNSWFVQYTEIEDEN